MNDLGQIIDRLKKHNDLVEKLLKSKGGREQLQRFVEAEIALSGYLALASEGKAAGSDERNERWFARAKRAGKRFWKNHGGLVKALFNKLNGILTSQIGLGGEIGGPPAGGGGTLSGG